MAKVNSFLSERLKMATEKFSKMANLAEQASSGGLSTFSGIFRTQKLTSLEEENLRDMLFAFSENTEEIETDLSELITITSEVKAISNQAAILHGERIKKVQGLLKNYKDGAFSAWLIAAYGNRQTPYNFLQYYELNLAIPQVLRSQLEMMPRQIIYVLASREGDLKIKEEIIKSYKGQPKDELLASIRRAFPLASRDKRAQNLTRQTFLALKRMQASLQASEYFPSAKEKKTVVGELKAFIKFVEGLGIAQP